MSWQDSVLNNRSATPVIRSQGHSDSPARRGPELAIFEVPCTADVGYFDANASDFEHQLSRTPVHYRWFRLALVFTTLRRCEGGLSVIWTDPAAGCAVHRRCTTPDLSEERCADASLVIAPRTLDVRCMLPGGA